MEGKLSIAGVGVTLDDLKLCLLLYADDAALYSETREGLQEGLDILYDYCTCWKLTINTDKTKVMVFRRGGRLGFDDHWFYGEYRLEVVDQFCYLGIRFATSGKFNVGLTTLAEQASKAVFSMKHKLRDVVDPKPNFLCDLFDKLVAPILMYGCEVWGFAKAEQIERVHTRFCKSVLHITRHSSANYFCYGELGRRPLRVTRMARIIKYWLNLVSVKRGTLMHSVYMLMKVASENNVTLTNWVSLVKQLLCNLGFHDVWMQQGVGDRNRFSNICKQRLNDQYLQDWTHVVSTSSDGILYQHLKRELSYSQYLNDVNIPKYRYSLVRFITRNHKLTIITERWNRARPYAQRLCHVCNVLDDEYHCVLECTKYTELRRKYINRYYYRQPSMLKFVELVTSAHVKTIQGLAMFVCKSGVC
jgi:hypothetical protein